MEKAAKTSPISTAPRASRRTQVQAESARAAVEKVVGQAAEDVGITGVVAAGIATAVVAAAVTEPPV